MGVSHGLDRTKSGSEKNINQKNVIANQQVKIYTGLLKRAVFIEANAH
jgi:hypothetical protein